MASTSGAVMRGDVDGGEDGDVVIRSAQAQDIVSMAGLLAVGFQLVPPEFRLFSGMVSAGLQSDIRYRMAGPSLWQAFVAVDRMGQVVGTVEVQIQKPNFWLGLTGLYGYLSNLTVDVRSRRSGVAAALVQACEQQVVAWGREHIFLHVMGENTSARRLYLRSGYRIHSRKRGRNFSSGRLEEKLLLHRRLVLPTLMPNRSVIESLRATPVF